MPLQLPLHLRSRPLILLVLLALSLVTHAQVDTP